MAPDAMNTSTHPSPPTVSPLAQADAAWIALGVQHAVLARAMPVVRHDIAGLLTIMRMGAVVLRRRAGDEQALGPQLEQFEEHLVHLSDSVRRLRHWDLGPGTSEPLDETAQLARELAYPLLAMRGLDLTLGSEGAPLPTTRAPQQAVLSLLLGAIHALAEAPDGPPAVVRVLAVPGSEGRLRVQAEGHAPDAPPAAPTPGIPPLDGAALGHLARHLGAGLHQGAGWFEIEPPPVPPKPQG